MNNKHQENGPLIFTLPSSGFVVILKFRLARWDNPVGVPGIAEISISGTSAAIANAVYSATGKRIRNFPITPEKLLLPEGSEPPKTRLTSEPA
jgi:CO/xanthine dehydrogenase Mo-binding subunit